MLSSEVTSVDAYGNPLLHPVIHSHLGKDHHSPHPPRPRQIYTQIHFQIASLLTDTMFTLFTIRAEKILQTKPWKAWVEMSPVGSVVWLARKQLIPNVDSISFFALQFNSGQKHGSCWMPTLEADKWERQEISPRKRQSKEGQEAHVRDRGKAKACRLSRSSCIEQSEYTCWARPHALHQRGTYSTRGSMQASHFILMWYLLWWMNTYGLEARLWRWEKSVWCKGELGKDERQSSGGGQSAPGS